MKKHLILIISTIIVTIVGTIYSFKAKPVYEIISSAIILRDSIQNPTFSNPELRNRWVWIKDGLSLKSQLVTDLFLEDFIVIKENRTNEIKQLRKLVNIDFTGGDEGKFILKVKGQDAKKALKMNKSLLARLRSIVVEKETKTYQDIINQLKTKLKLINKLKNQESFRYYQEVIDKMEITKEIQDIQNVKNFIIIDTPKEAIKPFWPNKKVIIIVSLFLGFVLGLFCEYVLFIIKKND